MERSYSPDWSQEIARYEARRAPLSFAPDENLPPLDVDLAPLRAMIVKAEPLPPNPSSYAQKRHALTIELQGQPQITLLHGLLITCLRKASWPKEAPALFRRLWIEEAPTLLDHLSTRWMISAAITFADHGVTEEERRLGQSLNVLFSLLKLTEFERLYSGLSPDEAFRLVKKAKVPLPMGLEPFALKTGGLDVNLLAPLVIEARATPILGPLALELLDRLSRDNGTVFRRLTTMRTKLLARQTTT